MQDTSIILQTLGHFTGSERFYRHQLVRSLAYSEGVRYVAEACHAYWLIDGIAAHRMFTAAVRAEPFQVWKLDVEGREAALVCEDGNGRVVYREDISFTDFPLPGIEIWAENDVLYLPRER